MRMPVSLLVSLALFGAVNTAQQRFTPPEVGVPAKDIGAQALAGRKRAQLATVGQFNVTHQFHFTDKVTESGITFRHHIVDDAGKHYKMAHYDHGNGVAAADVDGDGLTDIYFVSQLGGNELWKNLGGGKFGNITPGSGVEVAKRISVTASFGDIDNDGDQDLFVTTVRGGNLLFENDGRGRFKDITRAAGVGLVAHSSGAVFFDYDRDGLLDLLVCNVGKYTSDTKGPDGAFVALPDAFRGFGVPGRLEHPILYRNMGRRLFKDVTAQVGLAPSVWSGDAIVTDVNRDGWPDVFLLVMAGSQRYYENVAGRRFVDKTAKYFPKTPMGAMGIASLDFDNDGRMDLFLTDMHADMVKDVDPPLEKLKPVPAPRPDRAAQPLPQGAPVVSMVMAIGNPSDYVLGNALFRGTGAGPFEEVSDRMGVETYWPWGASVGDLNADGWTDIFVTAGMNYPFRYGINSLLLNNLGRKFHDAEFILGVEPRKGGQTRTLWYEDDCSIPVRRTGQAAGAQGLGPCLGQTGKVRVMAALGSRSSVIFDLDNDGDLDIVTSDFNSGPQVLVSDLSGQRALHWVSVTLKGTVSNRNGIGSTVRVVAGKQTYTRYVDGKSGYLAQSVLPLYFGLGEAESVDRIEVDWPSGRKQVERQGLRTNQHRTISEAR